MIGIIGAMYVEIEKFLELVTDVSIIKIACFKFYKAKYKNLDVVILQTGIGMVNAAVGTTLLINNFKVDKIIFSGIAGSTNENVKLQDVVIGNSFVEYQFDVTSFGRYVKGQRAGTTQRDIEASTEMLELVKSIDLGFNIHYGLIASGDIFVDSYSKKKQISDEFGAIAVDMESASVADVCEKFDISYLIVRTISDSMIDNSGMEYEKFEKIAADNSKLIVTKILDRLC